MQAMLSTACNSVEPINNQDLLYIHLLKSAYDESCSRYVDQFLEHEEPSAADRLSERSVLVFLLDDDLPLPQLSRDRTLSEMVADKLRRRQSVDSVASEQSGGPGE